VGVVRAWSLYIDYIIYVTPNGNPILDDVMFIQLFALVIMNMISTTHPHATEFTHDIPIIRDVLSAIKHNDHKTVTSMYIIVYIYLL